MAEQPQQQLTSEEFHQLRTDLEELAKSQDRARPYHDLAKEHFKAYKMFSDVGDDWPYPHKIHTADTFAFTEDAVAKNMQAFTQHDPMVAVRPRQFVSIQAERIANQLERVMQIMFDLPEAHFYEEFEQYNRQAAQLGTGFLYQPPEFKQGRHGPALDYVRFETLDFWGVYPHHGAVRIGDESPFFIRRHVPLQTLLDMQEAGFPFVNLDTVETQTYTGKIDDDWGRLLADIGLNQGLPEGKDEVEVVYIFDRGNVRILANRSVVIHDSSAAEGESPFVYGVPVTEFQFIPQVREFYGLGIPWMLHDLQLNRNTMRSQRMTNVDLVLSPPMKVNLGSEIDVNNLVMYPNVVFPVNEPDDITWDAFPDVTSSSYKEDAVIQQDMESATSLYSATRGMAESKRQSGREVSMLRQSALSRYDAITKRMEMKSMREIARRQAVYIHQFMEIEDYQEMLGEEDAGFFQLPLHAVMRGLKFVPVGTSVSRVPEERMRQMAYASQVLFSIPPEVGLKNLGGQKPFIVDYYEVIHAMLKSGQLPNIDRFVKQLPPQGQPQPQQSQQPQEDPRAQIIRALQGGNIG
jgi:hypothetical protein